MSRVHLALRVADLEESIKFYFKLFEAEPVKLPPGYANFAIAEPPLELVLIEGQARDETRMGGLRRQGRRQGPAQITSGAECCDGTRCGCVA
jgi:catechol 2,3-dioxygenase-like lactoylglutathione lyase family enzyme